MPASTALLNSALDLAKRGWPVFPLVPGGSYPALHGESQCPGTGACKRGHQKWEQRATTDSTRVRTCWTHDAYNIGLATGPAGLVVLDFDVPKLGKPVPAQWAEQGVSNGIDVFLLLCANAGEEPPLDTLTVRTPSGGTHLYFTAPADRTLRITQGERNGLGWGIDTRAHGGYVVAPGSVRADGSYDVTDDPGPAPLPAWIADKLAPRELPEQVPSTVTATSGGGYVSAAVRAEVQRVEQAAGGERNFALYCAASALGQLVAGGSLDEADATSSLLHAAQSHVAAGAYRWTQASKTIASGLRAGSTRPRKVAA